MAHELTIRRNGVAEMAYVGEVPWHGLGNPLQPGASIETWREAAGMDWDVMRSPVMFEYGSAGAIGYHPSVDVIYRSDNHQSLATVSAKYKIVQPGEVLEFFRDLTDANGYTLHTAGTLFSGRRFWALASIGEEAIVTGEDKVGGYLLLSTSCDGTLATSARFTTVRVVCNNTLSMAMHDKAKREVCVRHTTKFQADKVKDQLGLARGHFATFLGDMRKLANTPIAETPMQEFIGNLLVDTKLVFKKDVTKTRQFQKITELYHGAGMGSQQDGVAGSLWGVVNAVTEFVDHHARSTSVDHRMTNAWFGRGEDVKNLALERALALAA